eukprot:2012830-Alexandrium_andersonii.AAC.1
MVCAAAPCNAALEAIAAGASQPGWLSFSLTAWATDQYLSIWSTGRGDGRCVRTANPNMDAPLDWLLGTRLATR